MAESGKEGWNHSQTGNTRPKFLLFGPSNSDNPSPSLIARSRKHFIVAFLYYLIVFYLCSFPAQFYSVCLRIKLSSFLIAEIGPMNGAILRDRNSVLTLA